MTWHNAGLAEGTLSLCLSVIARYCQLQSQNKTEAVICNQSETDPPPPPLSVSETVGWQRGRLLSLSIIRGTIPLT